MKCSNVLLACALFAAALLCTPVARADSVPELLHYRFDGTGMSVPNLASAPPAGTQTAALMGGLTQTGDDLNFLGTGHALLGTGSSSSTDYLNTNWAPNLLGSWTLSFVTQDITPSSVLFYVFGDINAGEWRCFTNGVAGPNNWILRGPFGDVTVPGGATVERHRTTFVYDMPGNVIRAYLDGVLVNTVPQAGIVIIGMGPFKVGGYSTNTGLPAGGRLDDFRLYDRALSEVEVQAIDTKAAIAVIGNTLPIANGDTTPDVADNTDFGGVAPGGGSVQNGFSIRNDGNAPLEVGSITVTGAAASDFTIVDAPSGPIAPGAAVALELLFQPSVGGLREATVTLTSNSFVDEPFVFAIRGTGLVPEIGLSGNGVPIDNGDTTPDAADLTAFGTWPLGGTAPTHAFAIINAGTAPLSITSVSIDGATSADFAIVLDPSGETVQPGDAAALDIAFAPLAPGARSATVTIASNAPDDGVYTFVIAGTGEAADVQVGKTNFQPHLQAGVETVYTVQVLNVGPGAVSAVRIVDALPPNLLDGAWNCVSVPAGLCQNASGGPDIDETVGPLPSGALLEFTLIATPTGVPSDFVSNTATAENLDGSDPALENNTATDTDPIVPAGIFLDGFESGGKRLLVPRIGS